MISSVNPVLTDSRLQQSHLHVTQTSRRIRVKGLVQGVGFRPFVWKLAIDLRVSGHVLNDSSGVLIEASAPTDVLDLFQERLQTDAPVLARVDRIDVVDGACFQSHDDFRIVHSEKGAVSTGVVPDAATCPACLQEIFDPVERRYRYAFANCTHCGPRLSILRYIPYDRASTSMSVFPMCAACKSEYENPADRRFHAQPVACPECGPELWFENLDGERVSGDPVGITAEALRAGKIIAIKGLGGFQIAVDAGNETAIAALRQRKHRPDKPLALMARDTDQIRRYCLLDPGETEAIGGPAAPIVLLEKTGERLADNIAPGQETLGFMLPNTPLHHLLLAEFEGPIILTSGNLSENPQEIDNDAALHHLGGIVDGFLMHDREIVNRLDDSVMRVGGAGPMVLRRARGLAPAPIRLSPEFVRAPKVLAMGGELKSTFCLLNGRDAVLSQHIGDLENAATFADYRKTLQLYLELYQFEPEVIAVDCHPNYLSTVYGKQLADDLNADLVSVQHHHAHLAACLAEHSDVAGPQTKVHGIVLDGLGWGNDDTVWGGEILQGGFWGFERLGHFAPVALPGGAAAIREPWRNLAAHLHGAFGPGYRDRLRGTQVSDALDTKQTPLLHQIIGKGLNSPQSSSAGRLFDAVAAAVCVCFDRQSFEGQAGMLLESLAQKHMATSSAYPISVSAQPDVQLSFHDMWRALINDLKESTPVERISARFHLGLIEGLAKAVRLSSETAPETVVLSGGVFQNAILRDGMTARLRADGFNVLNHHIAPANDGGLALGQAAIAAAKSMEF